MSAGRKKIILDWEKVDKMLEAGLNGVEVSEMLGISFDTLSNRVKEDKKTDFSEYSRLKRSKGDGRLKLSQFNIAMNGSEKMNIWLGKQRLGQSDKKEIKQELTGEALNVNFLSTGKQPKTSENEVEE